MVSKSCGLRPGWLTTGSTGRSSATRWTGAPASTSLEAGEIRLHRELEDVQRAAALGAHRLRAEHARGTRP